MDKNNKSTFKLPRKSFFNGYNNFLFGFLSVLMSLSLFIFLPLQNIGMVGSKNILSLILFSTFGLFSFAFWILTEKNEYSFRNGFAISLGIFFLVTIFSLVQSPNLAFSFSGYGFQSGAASFLILLSCLGFFSFFLATKKQPFLWIIAGLFISYSVLILHTFVYWLSSGKFLNFGFLRTAIDTLAGSWSDFAIVNALIFIITISSLYFIKKSKTLRIFLVIFSFLSGGMLLLSGIKIIWVFTSIIFFFLFLYGVLHYYSNIENEGKSILKLPWIPLVVFLFSVFAIFLTTPINNLIRNQINSFSYSDFRLSYQSTFVVTKNSLEKDFLTGLGPNTFALAWQKSRPESAIKNPLSDLDIQYGYSWFFTQISSLGVFGLFSIIAIFGVFLKKSLELFKKPVLSGRDYYGIIFSLLAIFLWFLLFFYIVGFYLIAFCFIFTGLSIGLNFKNEDIKQQNINSTDGKIVQPSLIWQSVVVSVSFGILILSLLLSIVGGYKTIISEYRLSNVDNSRSQDYVISMVEEIVLANKQDRYFRVLAQIKLDKLLAEMNDPALEKVSEKKQKDEIVSDLKSILDDVQFAIKYNNSNYLNFATAGDIFLTLERLGIEGSLDQAIFYYNQAKTIYPNSLEINNKIAQVYYIKKDIDQSKKIIEANLKLRPADISSLILLYQIFKDEKQDDNALLVLKNAVNLNPNSPTALSFLGMELENQNQLDQAIKVYEKIVSIYPNAIDIRKKLISIYKKTNQNDLAKIHQEFINSNS